MCSSSHQVIAFNFNFLHLGTNHLTFYWKFFVLKYAKVYLFFEKKKKKIKKRGFKTYT